MYEFLPDLLTRKETQKVLHVGQNTILNLIHTQRLPAIMIGNSFRVKKADLIDFIENSVYWQH